MNSRGSRLKQLEAHFAARPTPPAASVGKPLPLRDLPAACREAILEAIHKLRTAAGEQPQPRRGSAGENVITLRELLPHMRPESVAELQAAFEKLKAANA